jgi:hypothetical protein
MRDPVRVTGTGKSAEFARHAATPPARQAAGDLPRRLALATFLLVAPTYTLATWFRPHNAAVYHFGVPVLGAEAMLIACSIASGVSPFRGLKRLARSTLLGALCVLATALSATLLNAVVPTDAALHLLMTVVHLLFCLCLWQAFDGPWRDMRRSALACLAAGIGLHILIGYPLLLSVRHDPNYDWMRPFLGGTNVRHLGYYASSLCGLSAGLLATDRSSRMRSLYLILLVLGFAWSDFSGSRGGFCAGVIGVAVVLLLAERTERLNVALSSAAAFAIALPPSIIWVPPSNDWGLRNMIDTGSNPAFGTGFSNGRTELWRKAIAAIAQHPIIGHGEGQFFFQEGMMQVHHPHNSILQFLYQWGVLGLAGVVAMTFATLRRLRLFLHHERPVALPALGALAAETGLSLIDGTFYHEFPAMVVLTCLAVLAGIREDAQAA